MRNQTEPGRERSSEEDDELDDALHGDVDGQHEGEGVDAGDGGEEEREGGCHVDDAEEDLPEDGSGAALRPGVGEVEDAAEEEQPAEEEAGGDGGEEGKDNGHQTGDDEEDSEQDGPAGGGCGGGYGGAHGALLKPVLGCLMRNECLRAFPEANSDLGC